MRHYVENVPPSLTQKELHDRAYALLYRVLKDEWGIASPVVEKTPLGQPYLKGENMPHISLSHTKGIVCCAVSRKNVGIDAEYPRRVRGSAAERVCTPAELRDIQSSPNPAARFLAYWTLKESISKCRGTGLSESFQNYEITFQNGNFTRNDQFSGFNLRFNILFDVRGNAVTGEFTGCPGCKYR